MNTIKRVLVHVAVMSCDGAGARFSMSLTIGATGVRCVGMRG